MADPYQAVVGPTGRGITGDIVTFSHPDDTPAAARRRASRRATARRSCRPASTTRSSSTARASTRSRTSWSPASGPIATTPRARSAASRSRSSSSSTASTRSTSATSATCCPRRSSATSARSTSPACRSAARSRPTKAAALVAQLDPQDRRPDAALRGRRATAPRRSRSSSTRWAPSRPRSRSCRSPLEPARRDDHRPAGVARQAGLTAGAAAQPRSRTTRPRLMTVRTRSAAGQYGIWPIVGTRQITRSARLAAARATRSRPPARARAPR